MSKICGLKSQICSNIACGIWDICTKTNCGFQQQMHMEQSTELTRISGNIAASFPAVTYGPLYYRHLEKETTGLKYHKDIRQN